MQFGWLGCPQIGRPFLPLPHIIHPLREGGGVPGGALHSCTNFRFPQGIHINPTAPPSAVAGPGRPGGPAQQLPRPPFAEVAAAYGAAATSAVASDAHVATALGSAAYIRASRTAKLPVFHWDPSHTIPIGDPYLIVPFGDPSHVEHHRRDGISIPSNSVTLAGVRIGSHLPPTSAGVLVPAVAAGDA